MIISVHPKNQQASDKVLNKNLSLKQWQIYEQKSKYERRKIVKLMCAVEKTFAPYKSMKVIGYTDKEIVQIN